MGNWIWLWAMSLVCAVGALVMAWRAGTRAERLEQQYHVLLGNFLRLETSLRQADPMPSPGVLDPQRVPTRETAPLQAQLLPSMAGVGAEMPAGPPPPPYEEQRGPSEMPPPLPPSFHPEPERKPFDWERFLGVKLPVWLGAIALSFAGFFFVSYAIDTGLFGPRLRVLGGVLLGALFLVAAEAMRSRKPSSDGPDIATALAAASIATLYASVYAAAVLYRFLPPTVGLLGMGAVTALSIIIAPRFGQILALVGLLGGYLSPLWYGGSRPSAPLLFGYLAAIFAAFAVIMRLRSWWHLAPAALAGPALWTIAWSFSSTLAEQPIAISAFLIAIPAITLLVGREAWAEEGPIWFSPPPSEPVSWPRRAGTLSALLPSLGFPLLLVQSGFALPFWFGLATFSALAVLVGTALPPLQRLQLIALGGVLLALAMSDREPVLARLIVGFGALFAISSLEQLRRLREPILWSGVLGATLLACFALFTFRANVWADVLANPHPFAVGALLLSAFCAGLLLLLYRRITNTWERSGTTAALLAAATGFVSLAIIIELDPSLLPTAAALEVLALALLYRRFRFQALASLAAVLFAGALLLLLSALLTFPEFALTNLARLPDSPLQAFALPGLAFVLAGGLFAREAPRSRLADLLDIGGLVLLAWGLGQYLLPDASRLLTAEAHLAASPVFAPEAGLALLAALLGVRANRLGLAWAGLGLALLLVTTMILALALPVYSLWPAVELGPPGLLNAGWLSLGLPAALLIWAGRTFGKSADSALAIGGAVVSVAAVFLLFTLMLLEIRHFFHPDLLQGSTSQLEHYVYSLSMLLFGLVLLVAGIAMKSLAARVLSLVVVLAATLKVFLFDAAELEGLWRILSFGVMGLAFLAISWFYARFVFGLKPKAPSGGEPPPIPV